MSRIDRDWQGSAVTARSDAGRTGYHAGRSAEGMVARDYARRGYPLAADRWRGEGGEIDLILRDGDGLIFVEVKKSRSFARAALRLGRPQQRRICAAAEEFAATEPRGSLTEMRFDLAVVNAQGEIHILENAFGA
ncbi:YraN family protein [Litorisediminicola beolgyonensis]|uniref:UPF0102 protein ACFQ4E_19840 n=1 Tax=Litorisediminicola beolgyonensis TaxID=1173614 RepID=A0ABW3ZNK2_9RHOB